MILELLLNGLVQGSLLALICIGYSLAYGTARVITFPHPDVMIAGGGYLVLFWSGVAAGGTDTPLLMAALFAASTYLAALVWLKPKSWVRHLIAGCLGAFVFSVTLGMAGR